MASRSERFYEEELDYLHRGGAEYARQHPERARYLNLEDPWARDPHVERLIESFAFLAGSVREKIEDEFPELTHSLIHLVWPHYLRPIPPMAMLEMQPLPGMLSEGKVVDRGLLVDSQYTSAEVPCRFRTAYPVHVYPFKLHEARLETDPAGRRSLLMTLRMDRGCENPERVRVDRLRFYMAGDPEVAYRTYRVLRQLTESVELRFGRGRRRRFPSRHLRPVGFGEGEELLPYPNVSFPGYRLLSEYFAYPAKFLFLDLVDLGALDGFEDGEETFSLEFSFRRRPPENFRPATEDFRLYVTPVVNLFERHADPVEFDHAKERRQLLASATRQDAYEILSVDEVLGAPRGRRETRPIPSFLSFDHDRAEEEAFGPGGLSYHVTHGLLRGRWDTRISLIASVRGELPETWVLSPRVTCMNGALCKEVGQGDIRVPVGSARLDFVNFRNITRPTAPIYPDLGKGAEWRFISHMALNFLSLGEASSLRRLLTLYNSGDREGNRRRIDSILDATLLPREEIRGGAPVRGTQIRLRIDEERFEDHGDLILFRDVLSEFLSLYANVNSFTRLEVHLSPSEEVLECPAVPGRQPLI